MIQLFPVASSPPSIVRPVNGYPPSTSLSTFSDCVSDGASIHAPCGRIDQLSTSVMGSSVTEAVGSPAIVACNSCDFGDGLGLSRVMVAYAVGSGGGRRMRLTSVRRDGDLSFSVAHRDFATIRPGAFESSSLPDVTALVIGGKIVIVYKDDDASDGALAEATIGAGGTLERIRTVDVAEPYEFARVKSVRPPLLFAKDGGTPPGSISAAKYWLLTSPSMTEVGPYGEYYEMLELISYDDGTWRDMERADGGGPMAGVTFGAYVRPAVFWHGISDQFVFEQTKQNPLLLESTDCDEDVHPPCDQRMERPARATMTQVASRIVWKRETAQSPWWT